MKLSKHPGYLGWTSKGVIAIHADWPVYPIEHGWAIGLLTFGLYPRGTVFNAIDDIDKCMLFCVGKPGKNPYDENNYHVAVWHEDLIDLQKRRYVSGVREINSFNWELKKWGNHEELYFKLSNGSYGKVPKPIYDPDDTDEFADIGKDGLKVTRAGFLALKDLLKESGKYINPKVSKWVKPYLEIKRYDTAIREGFIIFENEIKKISKINSYGQKLIELFIKNNLKEDKYIGSHLKTLRSELRMIFKYYRNEFAHNFKQVELEQANVILWKISDLMKTLNQFRKS